MTTKDKKNFKKISKTSKEYQRSKACKICGTFRGVISKYNLKICRRCFNEVAFDLGFKKYD